MASVNATRGGLAQNINHATEGAELIGFNDNGLVCVWTGGYTFNVYDAAQDWHEVRAFTSGDLAGTHTSDMEQMKKDIARERMESEGFRVV